MQKATLILLYWIVLFCFGRFSFGQEISGEVQESNTPPETTSAEIASEVCPGDSTTCLNFLVDELRSLPDRCGVKALLLRQTIMETVETASLQVDGFLAEVDDETSKIRAVHDDLAGRRDTWLSRSTLGSSIGTGGGAVGSALALGSKTAVTWGGWVGAVFGGVGTVAGFLGYIKQGGPEGCFPELTDPQRKTKKVKGCPLKLSPDDEECQLKMGEQVKRVAGCSPTMLSKFFNPEKPVGFHSEYDRSIQKYLDGRPPSLSGKSRKEDLNERWGGPMDATLTNGDDDPQKVSIDQLENRANKLADLRAVVARLNRDLSRFMAEELATDFRCNDLNK